MNQVAAAAAALQGERLNGDLCRALETAIAVCYSRPYGGSNRVGVLGNEWLPEDPGDLAVHARLLELRDQVYAHTDRTDARDITDVFGDGFYAEEWRPLRRSAASHHQPRGAAAGAVPAGSRRSSGGAQVTVATADCVRYASNTPAACSSLPGIKCP